jgi:hypothetical protein
MALERSRMKIMGHYGGWRSKLLRLWQEWDGFNVEINTETRGPWEFELPHWPWRWVCLIQGHEPWGDPRNHYCIVCRKDLA